MNTTKEITGDKSLEVMVQRNECFSDVPLTQKQLNARIRELKNYSPRKGVLKQTVKVETFVATIVRVTSIYRKKP